MGRVPILTKTEIRVLEASMRWSTYSEAATSIDMTVGTFYTMLSRIRAKDRNHKRFERRMRRYRKTLYKRYEEGEEEEE